MEEEASKLALHFRLSSCFCKLPLSASLTSQVGCYMRTWNISSSHKQGIWLKGLRISSEQAGLNRWTATSFESTGSSANKSGWITHYNEEGWARVDSCQVLLLILTASRHNFYELSWNVILFLTLLRPRQSSFKQNLHVRGSTQPGSAKGDNSV